jgi:hypothetical protein
VFVRSLCRPLSLFVVIWRLLGAIRRLLWSFRRRLGRIRRPQNTPESPFSAQ